MKSYFIRRSDVFKIDNEKIVKIDSLSDIHQFTIGSSDGWLVENIELLEKILRDFKFIKIDEVATSMQGIFVVSFKKDNSKPQKKEVKNVIVFDDSKTAYIKACQNRVKTDLSDIKNEISEIEEKVIEMRKQFIDTTRRKEILELRSIELNGIYQNRMEKYEGEYQRILENEKVQTLNVKANVLEIYTHMLFVTDSKKNNKYEIGKFCIKIPMNGEGEIIWKNKTMVTDDSVNVMNAPNIFGNGFATTNEVREILPEIIAHYEFSNIVNIAINYIEDIENISEMISEDFIKQWPKVKKPRKIKKRSVKKSK